MRLPRGCAYCRLLTVSRAFSAARPWRCFNGPGRRIGPGRRRKWFFAAEGDELDRAGRALECRTSPQGCARVVRVRARRVRVGSRGGRRHDEGRGVGIGDSHGAEKVLAREFPTERAAEQVLIQSRSGPPWRRAELRAAVDDLIARLSRVPAVAAIESPLDAGNAGQLARDGRSALLTFQITGDPDTAQDRVGPALAATAAVQRAHPELLDRRGRRCQRQQGDQRPHRRATSSGRRSRRCP